MNVIGAADSVEASLEPGENSFALVTQPLVVVPNDVAADGRIARRRVGFFTAGLLTCGGGSNRRLVRLSAPSTRQRLGWGWPTEHEAEGDVLVGPACA